MTGKKRLIIVGAFLFGALLCWIFFTSGSKQTEMPVHVVSWGGKFQDALVNKWLQPAADQAEVQLKTSAWDGDYGSLQTRILGGINQWDLVHVEDHFV